MSYTFSRRDFFKYTALAAVAVAGSSLLTGCSNPNQPSAVYTGKADSTLSFGGSTGGILGIGASSDYQTLKSGATYTNGTLVFEFEHYAVSEGCSCTANYYQIDVVGSDGKAQSYYNGSKCGDNDVTFTSAGGAMGMKVQTVYTNKLTITGIDFTGAKSVSIRYFPRYTALAQPNDSYSDVYATWDITSFLGIS